MQLYKNSEHALPGTDVCMTRGEKEDFLWIKGSNPGFEGEDTPNGFIAPLSHNNAELLRKLFPFTAPSPILKKIRTVGVGDRLGIATPGQLCAFADYDAVPVLAQQSIRELNLTGRTFMDVLDAVTFAVFREDYQGGFGADGDHLMTEAEVEYALSCGYTMITLDCREKIRNDINEMTDEEVNAAYEADAELEKLYCGNTFTVEGCDIHFSEMEFKRTCLMYCAAIDHAAQIFNKYIAGKDVDFEMSIDETSTPTTPAQHYFVSSELVRRGVDIATVAPRFCGEFQKGIDYIGDIEQFESEMKVHAAIARKFGYKLSIHSGSDKFSVFPIIGKYTHGNFHVKTAGTNWLEAMRVIAMAEPALYREVHMFALTAFDEATKYYHVTTDLAKVPDISFLKDEELPNLFEMNDARQLIHITYGLILQARAEDGSFIFRDRLYDAWRKNGELLDRRLHKHIGKHLELLYSGFKKQ